MAEIPLRTYVEQLDNLIERKQVDEVIAHCRHILGLYPKHIDTYRMLGKALLEKGRHGDAADIFQRVLSVIPDDFISHVGMSIVREDEANLDAAIWHMERAFEASPANGAIQQELCRLYGRRDGVVPAKVRLTRGALARMYAQGGLYLQAEAELQAALAAETDRIDLLTVLADVYWQTDQLAPAAQTATAILQKLPYSLEANRLLVNVLRLQDRRADAAAYRQRLEALDPYEAFADPAGAGARSARVDAARVMVNRLDYLPGMEGTGSPDWLASIGAKFEDPAAARSPDAQPDWLSAASEPAPPAPSNDYQPGQGSVPDWLKDLEAGPATPAPQAAGTPEWLREVEAASPSAASADEAEELPDWLVSATGPLPVNSVPDWMLQTNAEAPSEPSMDSASPLAHGGEAATMPVPAASEQPTVPTPAGDLPDWLKSTVADETEDDLPDWLKAITAQPLPAVGAPASPDADAPDWLSAATDAQTAGPAATANEAAPTGPLPALAELPAVSAPTQPVEPLAAASPESPAPAELPDWLQAAVQATEALPAVEALSTAPAAPVSSAEPPAVEPVAPAPVAASVEPTAPTAPVADSLAPVSSALSDLPDWLHAEPPTTPATDTPATSAAPEPTAPEPSASLTAAAAELPDWLRDASPTPAPAEPSAPAELPDWLRDATAVPAAQDETPVWLQTAPAAPSLAAAPAPEPAEFEMPDWLKDVAAGAPPADATAPAATATSANPPAEPAPAVELPDYLQLASPEAIARAEQPLELEPEPETEEAETLALPAEIPDWLKALAPSPDPTPVVSPAAPDAAPPAAVAEEAAAASAMADSLSWMDELTAGSSPLDLAPAAAAAPEELPDWLTTPAPAAPEAASVVPGGHGDDTLAGEIPPWAQNEEPGPSDTIVSWLAGKHVPDWLRQPATDTPTLPAVEWEPGAPSEPAAVDSLAAARPELSAAPAPEPVAPAEASAAELAAVEPAAAEPGAVAAPDLDAMDPEAAFRWLEGLAAQQGARSEELFTLSESTAPAAAGPVPAEPAPALAAAQASVELISPLAEPPALAAEVPVEAEALQAPAVSEPAAPAAEPAALVEVAAAVVEPAPLSAEPPSLEEFLRQTEAALPVAPLADTAPSKKSQLPVAPEPAAAEPVAAATGVSQAEPVAPPEVSPAVSAESQAVSADVQAAPVAEPSSDFDADAALRWLEGLAAQQGANPDELLTAPEERTLEVPTWVAAEKAAAEAASQPAAQPVAPLAEPEPTPAIEPMTPTVGEVSALAVATVETSPAEAPTAPQTEPVTPPAEPLAEPAVSEAEPAVSQVAPAAEPSAVEAESDEDAAMRWLEGLAAKQGANPDELLTAPEERTLEAPTWVSAETAEAAALAAASQAVPDFVAAEEPRPAPVEAEPEPAPEAPAAAAPEPPQWLKDFVPELETTAPAAVSAVEPSAEPAAVVAPEAAPAAEPPDWLKTVTPTEELAAPASEEPAPSKVTADLEKLSRLSERLAAARRAREAEMEARFAEQRAQQEAARQFVEQRLEARRSEPEPGAPASAEPEPAAPPAPVVAEPQVMEAAVTPPAVEPPAPVPAETPAPMAEPKPVLVRPNLPRPSIHVQRPRPAPVVASQPVASPVAGQPAPTPASVAAPVAPAAALAQGQAALAGRDYETAVGHLSGLVQQGQHLDTVVASLEGAVSAERAPVAVLRLLGDAYMRTDQLQKALDAYRQALSRL